MIFIIRTTQPFRSQPHPLLIASSLTAFGLAMALPFSPLAPWLGFVPLPASLMAALAGLAVPYLAVVYAVRRWFFARYGFG